MDNNDIVTARILDKIGQASGGYYAVATGFLDLHEQSLLRQVAHPVPAAVPAVSKGSERNNVSVSVSVKATDVFAFDTLPIFRHGDVNLFLYGGYNEADRCIMIAAPESLAETYSDILRMDEWLAALRVSKSAASRELTHRDYLGSILSLGLERSAVGDILVRKDGADIIIKPEIKDFLMTEYSKAGRTNLSIEEIGIGEIIVPEQQKQELSCTVSSTRLDNIVSAAFHLSRSEAVRGIARGLVSVNHCECLKADKKIEAGSSISLRGKGKIVFADERGRTRKGKVEIRLVKYL